MSYTLEFATENVIVQHVRGSQSIEDLAQSCREIVEMIDNMGQDCYLLIDSHHMTRGEGTIVKVREATQPLFTHPRLRLVVMYGSANEIVAKFLANILSQLFKLPMQAVSNQATAIDLLIKQDPSLSGRLQEGLKQLANA